ncbi:pentapeptide repeat-containing protein [Geminocystis sp. CENA526]|uniref:pentapeptide repeat-containing protein n=1 Tax=Geminocystis sp. CENA526 TaxID=1355871 RepID=UPI003D6E90BD
MSQEKLTPQELISILGEASNENTPPQRLEEIYQNYKDSEIKSALTSNPNTALEILVKLAEDYPVQFLENPALDLYLLSNPKLLIEMPTHSLISIFKQPQIPQEFFSFVLNHIEEFQKFNLLNALLRVVLSHGASKWNQWRETNPSPYLGSINLSYINPRYPDVRDFDLSDFDLSDFDLSGINLSDFDLSGIKLSYAKLSGADLSGANLTSANLSDAYLGSTNLTSADLSNANLSSAKLSCADLRNANLTGADLRNANLTGADLTGARGI